MGTLGYYDYVEYKIRLLQCDLCGCKFRHDGYCEFLEKEDGTIICWECSFKSGFITEKMYVEHSNFCFRQSRVSVITQEILDKYKKVYPETKYNVYDILFWQGKYPPWEKTKENLDRSTSMYKRWKKSVLKRDDYTCQKCGSKNKIEVHHIKSFKYFPELRFSVDNGIIFCAKCHKEERKNK